MERSPGTGLRPARVARGWSQSDAARELAALARARGTPVAAAASLKTLLSRWENGHSLPEPQYRRLLVELYERTSTELGIEPPGAHAPTTGRARLLAAVAAATAVDRAGIDLWWDQLAAVRRLDDELGAAGAGELVSAQVDRLDDVLTHTTAAPSRAAVAAVLAAAAALAGAQALDRGHHDEAWRRYHRSRTAATEADLPVATAVAVAGQAEVLTDAGDPQLAIALLAEAGPVTSVSAGVRLDAARGMAIAAIGEDRAARAALAAAEQGMSELASESSTQRPLASESSTQRPLASESSTQRPLASASSTQRPRDAPTERSEGERTSAGATDVVAAPDGPAVELADLHRWHGRALVALGDSAAATPLERALAARPRSVRDRAAVHADLALALHAHRPEAAAHHARTARELALGTGSHRIAARLAGLGGPG